MATTQQLVDLLGIMVKDGNHDDYPEARKEELLSIAQENVARLLPIKYLRELVKKVSPGSISASGIALETDFLKPAYFATSAGVPIRWLEVEDLGLLQNTIEGGTDIRPRWYYEEVSGTLTLFVLVDSYPLTGTVLHYIQKPPTLESGVQDPKIVGFDHLMLLHAKYIIHISEGQAQLAQVAKNAFDEDIARMNGKFDKEFMLKREKVDQ